MKYCGQGWKRWPQWADRCPALRDSDCSVVTDELEIAAVYGSSGVTCAESSRESRGRVWLPARTLCGGRSTGLCISGYDGDNPQLLLLIYAAKSAAE